MWGAQTFELNPEQMWRFVKQRWEGEVSVDSGNSSLAGRGLCVHRMWVCPGVTRDEGEVLAKARSGGSSLAMPTTDRSFC